MTVWTAEAPARAVATGLAVRPLTLALLAALGVATVATPMFLVDVAPMMDYPGHLTRLTLLSHLPLDPLVARAYAVDFRLTPNLAVDLFVPAIAPLVGANVGLKLFMTIGLALWVAGAALIHRGLWREWSAQSLFAVLFAANPSFLFGFANFHVGAGAALTATGVWLSFGRRSAGWLVGMAAAALALLICHLMALALFGLLMAGFEAGRLRETRAGRVEILRAGATGAAIFAPALVVWALTFEHARGAGIEFHWMQNLLGLLFFSSAAGARQGNMLPVAALIAALLVARVFDRLAVAGRAVPALALAALAMLLSPAVAMSGSLIQMRMPSVVAVLALAALRIEMPARLAALAVAATLAGAAAAGEAQTARWRAGAATIEAMREAGRRFIVPGSRVASALGRENGSLLGHAADLAILDRAAFVPAFFTTRGQSTLAVRDAYRDIAAQDAIEGAIPTLADLAPLLGSAPPLLTDDQMRTLRPYRDLACAFDYLYVVGLRAPSTPAALRPLVERADFALYRIVPPPERGCASR